MDYGQRSATGRLQIFDLPNICSGSCVDRNSEQQQLLGSCRNSGLPGSGETTNLNSTELRRSVFVAFPGSKVSESQVSEASAVGLLHALPRKCRL